MTAVSGLSSRPRVGAAMTLRSTISANPGSSGQKGTLHRCHAGVVECVVPVVSDGELIAVLFAGQMRAGTGCCDIMSKQTLAADIWANESLRSLHDADEAQHVLNSFAS